jgi:RNA 2',3'-cyclic 3'-phosphodiesterase
MRFQMKRTFIAVKISAQKNFKAAFDILKKDLSVEKIKWVEDNNLHITLAFLGDTEENTITKINLMLEEKLQGTGKIDFRLKGFAVFKSWRDPKVIYTGVENPDKLVEVFNLIKSGLESFGIKLEEREFRPHLTLGRIKFLKDTDKLKNLISKYNEVFFQEVIVTEIILYESILKPEGPIYKPLKIISL